MQAKERGASIEVGGERVALGIPAASEAAAAARTLIPLARTGTPDEAAGALLLLACPYASYITGQVVEVTGGGWPLENANVAGRLDRNMRSVWSVLARWVGGATYAGKARKGCSWA